MARVTITESVSQTEPLRAERDEGGGLVVRGARLVAARASRNRDSRGRSNVYPRETLEAARDLYLNAPVYDGHRRGGGDRPTSEKIGQVVTVEADEGGLRGDLAFPPGPAADRVEWAAKARPDFFALSHHAAGVGEPDGDRVRITQIEAVHSVDLVARGGVCNTLFEDHQESPMKLKLAPLYEAMGNATEKLERSLLEMVDEDKLVAVLADSSLSPEEKVMQALAMLATKGEDPEAEDGEAEEPVAESAKPQADPRLAELVEQVNQLKADKAAAEKRARRQEMLVESKLPLAKLKPVLVEQVYAADKDEHAKDLIEALRAAVFHQNPTGSVPAPAADHNDANAFAAWIES